MARLNFFANSDRAACSAAIWALPLPSVSTTPGMGGCWNSAEMMQPRLPVSPTGELEGVGEREGVVEMVGVGEAPWRNRAAGAAAGAFRRRNGAAAAGAGATPTPSSAIITIISSAAAAEAALPRLLRFGEATFAAHHPLAMAALPAPE